MTEQRGRDPLGRDHVATGILLALSLPVGLYMFATGIFGGMDVGWYILRNGGPDIGVAYSYVMAFVPLTLVLLGDALAIVALARQRRAVWYAAGGLIVGVWLWLVLLILSSLAGALA